MSNFKIHDIESTPEKSKPLHMKKTIILLHLLPVILMSWFAIPKILGAKTSVQGFNEMSGSLPISSDNFRIFTGLTELLIVLLFAMFLALSLKKMSFLTGLNINKKIVSLLANGLLLTTMIGALIAEFVMRETPKYMLVYIAIGLIVITVINIIYNFNEGKTRQQ